MNLSGNRLGGAFLFDYWGRLLLLFGGLIVFVLLVGHFNARARAKREGRQARWYDFDLNGGDGGGGDG